MAFKKTLNNKNAAMKYSVEDRFKYHQQREDAPGRFNLKYGGTKHCYSFGFTDAFKDINNMRAVRGEFGVRSGNAYAAGYNRGRKVAMDYCRKTGIQPWDIAFKNKK